MSRTCVCGKPILSNRALCKECYEIYGDKENWPMWLSWMVGDIQRELNYDRNHKNNVNFFDESDFPRIPTY